MPSLTLKAHFNGTQVVFDEAADLKTNDKLLVTVLPNGSDPETDEWFELSSRHFDSAFGDEEPEYDLSDLKEANPEYDRG